MSAPRRIVLIPTYNEAGNVRELHSSIREACDFDLLFIDDSSPDGTAGIVGEIMTRDPGVRILSRPGRQGLGRAYSEAFSQVASEGSWDRVFMMDADLSHQPRHLVEIDRALEGCDFAVGSRYTRGVSVLNWSILRLNLSYAANSYVRLATGMPFSDCTSGFRGFRSGVLSMLTDSGIRASGYAFLVEMLYRVWRSGLRTAEVPIVFVERRSGASKISAGVFMESMLTPLRLCASRLLGLGA